MIATTFKVSLEYFTPEKTQEFVNDHELACQTMEAEDFAKIFRKYDLSIIEEYQEVITSIIKIMKGWKKEKLGTELVKVSTYNSNCIFCAIGQNVKVYQWTYSNTLEEGIRGRFVYKSKIGFRFEIKEGKLTEYGICNAFV